MTTQQPPLRDFGGGDYQEIESLGQGGFAEVFLVEDNLGRQWALKQLHMRLIQQDPRILERFEREAQIQAGLEHPHIAKIHTFNPREGYLVIEFIKGRNLRKLIDDEFPDGMDPNIALKILQPIEEALTYIHEHAGFAHLDITPKNILIQETRSRLGRTGQHVVLADFGLARVIDEDGRADLSAFAGTPGYWAPEQRGLTNDRPGMRSDIYALGVVIGVILTGLGAQEVLDILRGTRNTQSPMLPEKVKQVLQRATDVDPGRRYATVRGLVTAFKGAVGSTTIIPPPPPPPGRLLSRLVKIIAAVVPYYALIVTLLLLSFIIWPLVQNRLTTQPTYTTKLTGLDLGRYCSSLNYAGNIGILTCSSPVDMNDACNWQWGGRNDLKNEFKDPNDSHTGDCKDPNKKIIGGIDNMKGYCQHRYNVASEAIPNEPGTSAGWKCQQPINATIACIWQFSRTDVQARNEQGNLICYAP